MSPFQQRLNDIRQALRTPRPPTPDQIRLKDAYEYKASLAQYDSEYANLDAKLGAKLDAELDRRAKV
jgi:hypothetical protein